LGHSFRARLVNSPSILISGLIRRNAEAGNRLPHSSSEISANSVSFGATFQGKAESQPHIISLANAGSRANILADIATGNPTLEMRQRIRHLGSILNRVVSNTPICIYNKWLNCICGAGVNTTSTGAAVFSMGWRQIQGLSELRPKNTKNHTRVITLLFGNPTNSSPLCPNFILNWACIRYVPP